jgi:hypothetical protein
MTTAAASSSLTVPPTTTDRVRQVVVLVGSLVAAGAAAYGAGAFGGTAVEQTAGGALSADATPVAPDNPAFRIWSVIYLGLFVFAVYQVLPRHAATPRLRATAWWVLASMVLNAAWIGVVQAGWLAASVAVIAALLAVLAVIVVRLVRSTPDSRVQAVVLDGTVGLYTGWVSVATLANVAAALASEDVGELGLGASAWGSTLVVAGAVVAVGVAARTAPHRPVIAVATGLATGWGLAWIAVARFQGPLLDDTVAYAAVLSAVVAAVVPVVLVVVARRRR